MSTSSPVWLPKAAWYMAAHAVDGGVPGYYRIANPVHFVPGETGDAVRVFDSPSIEPPWLADDADAGVTVRAMCWSGANHAVYVVVGSPNSSTGEKLYKCDEMFATATVVDDEFHPGNGVTDHKTTRMVNVPGVGLHVTFFYTSSGQWQRRIIDYDASPLTGVDSVSLGLFSSGGLSVAPGDTYPYFVCGNCTLRDTLYSSGEVDSTAFMTSYWDDTISGTDYEGYAVHGAADYVLHSTAWEVDADEQEWLFHPTYDSINDRILVPSMVIEGFTTGSPVALTCTANRILAIEKIDTGTRWRDTNVTVSTLLDLPNPTWDGGVTGDSYPSGKPLIAWVSGLSKKLYVLRTGGESWGVGSDDDIGVWQYELDGTGESRLTHDFMGADYGFNAGNAGNDWPVVLGPGTRARWEL